jgi:formylglycine-generating enzyme required for sulfatase activity
MVKIPPGSFQMGAARSEAGTYADEGPLHRVTIRYAFEVAKYPVTRGDWRRYLTDSGKSGSAGCHGYTPSMAHFVETPSSRASASRQLLRTLQADRQHMRELLKTLGPRHPEMIRLQGQIDALEHGLDEQAGPKTTARIPVDPVLIQLQAGLVTQELSLAELLVTDGTRHPDVIRLQAKIDATRRNIKTERAQMRRLTTFEASLPRSPDEVALEQLRLALYEAQADMAGVLQTQAAVSPEARRQQRKIAALRSSINNKEAQIRQARLQYSWSAPGFPQQDDQPAVCVTWEQAEDYTVWLSRKTGSHYRLLSEAEYEYVARAGVQSSYSREPAPGNAQCSHVNAADDTLHTDSGPSGQAYAGCSDGFTFTSPVDHFPANAFGLHDTSGNVWSWVQDCYQGDYQGAPADGSPRRGGKECSARVVRGGAWDSPPDRLRAAARDAARGAYFNVGFRVARTLTP